MPLNRPKIAVESVTLITDHVKEFVSTKSNISDNIAGVIDDVFCSYFKFGGGGGGGAEIFRDLQNVFH